MSTLTQDAPRRMRDFVWYAALVHRISGVLLACFLPVHFLALSLALNGAARLDGFLRWTEQPLVQAAEAVLVFLLTVHLLGGLRVLLVEFFSWRAGRKQTIAFALGVSALVALGFYIGLR
jgi:succinate dehydrogenase subunit D